MTSAIKTFLVLLLALPLLLYIGSEIGSDEYTVPIIAGTLMISSLAFGLFFRSQRVECLILVMLLGGYIVGNRGFAQIYLVQPVFVGELGMLFIFAAMLCRYAVSREFIIAPHVLSRLIALYLIVAFIRLCFDWQNYGIDAVRDAALVYYAVFFFAAYQLGRRAETGRFLDRTLLGAFCLVAVVAVIADFEPDWLDVVTIRGIPVLLQKKDITATFCGLGALFISVRSDLLRARWVRVAFLLLLIMSVLTSSSRAALVSMCAALTLTWVAARRGFILIPLALGVFGIAAIFLLAGNSTGRLAATSDQLISIVDVSGTHHYQTDLGDEKQSDNNFRRALWDSIFKQTLGEGQWLLGKGFGYNFIADFQQEYRKGTWDNLRSAHNYYVTVFGRLGLVGALLFVVISFEIVRHGLRAALALRRGETQDPQSLAYWCAVWAILISGSFGVVLEGPMGAIPFWSFLGLALASDDRRRLAAKAEEAIVLVIEPVRERQRQIPRPALAR